jgi:hypothetical protein
MIPVNTLLWLFIWGTLLIVLGFFMTNPEALTVTLTEPSPAWVGVALCAVSLFLLMNQWFYGVLYRHRARNKKSEPREHTDEC